MRLRMKSIEVADISPEPFFSRFLTVLVTYFKLILVHWHCMQLGIV